MFSLVARHTHTHTYPFVHVLHVFDHHFIDLDYSSSDGDNGDYPIDLFGQGIDQREYLNDGFGLFYHDDDDEEEDNLTLFGKMIIMIELLAEYI